MRLRATACLIAALSLAAAGRAQAAMGVLDEAQFGVLDHDIAIGGSHREPGADFNGEALFVSPDFLAPIWAPRPAVGATVNSAGKNSFAYAGLTWTANFTTALYGNLDLGGAVHDGPDSSSTSDHKGLGTRALFHESAEFGYRFSPPWSVGVYLEHVSNADLGPHNPGLTDLGLRVGHSF